MKMYDKALHYKLLGSLLRLELGYMRSRVIWTDFNIKYFSDLRNPSISILSRLLLEDAFTSLEMFQNHFFTLPETEIKKYPEILQYGFPSFWCKLKSVEKGKLYRKALKNKRRISSKYFPYDAADQVRLMLKEKLNY